MNNPPPADPKAGTSSAPTPVIRILRRVVVHLLRIRVWFTERGPGDLWESNYFWAAVVGLCGAISSVLFRAALRGLEWGLFHYDGPLENVASKLALPWWLRL